jgi:hypothetical protein
VRLAAFLVPVLAGAPASAFGCPADQLATKCFVVASSFERLTHIIDFRYHVASTTTVDAHAGGFVDTETGVDLEYTAQLGSTEQAEYELAIGGGISAHAIVGSLAGTNLSTHARARIGPAPLVGSATDRERSNTVSFPFTFELEHGGDLAALPGLSARPDVLRAMYGRQRVAATTRAIRVEVGGSAEKRETERPVGPGGRTRVPESAAIDVLPVRAEVEGTMQDGLRLETTIGGALIGVVGRLETGTLEVLGLEHRAISLPTDDHTAIDTVWVARFDYLNPRSGTRYFIGWGQVLEMPGRLELLRELDIDHDTVTIGGLGWFTNRSWGGFGAQYRREPYVTMAAEPALDDRFTVEVYRPGAVDVVARWFGARTMRFAGGVWHRDMTFGLEADLTRRILGFDVTLHAEAGKTFYGPIDDARPDVGFGARAALSVQRGGSHRWTR